MAHPSLGRWTLPRNLGTSSQWLDLSSEGGMGEFSRRARAATEALRDLLPATPLQRNEHLSARFDAEIWLKREDLTPVRSYKLRGAFTAMRRALAVDPGKAHFVCASAGNHA